ncbi:MULTISPECIES: ABC transporter permease [unclassified Cupriavidus]|uniref:ABC transporter permease n=1 Tax=unclassified Cupriavidus TaxID=2640874 RepID=UPI001C001E51|nr:MULTISPECIES: ABC transporter permease [unclassified Cupriavidus]MCA3183444.1 ABC transporter permease [Cupriavidus sp.]MCA3194045.1 ABC transporter permease [Cupriavidus sp.]MCA3200315.1 ABC transporter permease [Cupriavidus sp.]MCA3233606.1 ABC transporter permease [Cupriavidus sp.]QWE97561.1 ABC transporter permease [Cupriavidus sp. EM10]
MAAHPIAIHAPSAGVPAAQSVRGWQRDWLTATVLAWPVPLALLALWYLAARFEWVPPQVLPAPDAVLATLEDLYRSGELWSNLQISALRVAGGFAVGLAGGLALGAAMGLSPRFRDYVYPTFKAFSQVPVLGWLPLLMLLVGIDEALKIILIAKAALVPIAINTCKGIHNVPTRYLEVARVMKLTRWQTLSRVVFPAAAAPVWNGVRYGLTHAWLALVVVELLASSEGLGYMIVYGRQLFQLDMVIAAVIVVGAVGFTLDKALALAEQAVLRWRKPGF